MTNIIASYWLVAGDRYPDCGDEASPFSFRERYETAGRLGFRGAGFVHDDLIRARDTIGYGELRRILTANGIEDVEVEILTDWFATGERRANSDRRRRVLIEAGEKLEARHLKVTADFTTKQLDVGQMGEAFAELCQDAAQAGLVVGLEVMPFTNIDSVHLGRKVIEAAGASNGGLLLDLWHMERGGIDLADIAALPQEMIISVEIDDAAAQPQGDIWSDTLHHRLPPGQGSFDVAGFLTAVASTGYDGPVGVEIIAEAHRKLPLAEAARIGMESSRPFLERLRATA
jgi:Sugar phosphate isomerases/epimerases